MRFRQDVRPATPAFPREYHLRGEAGLPSHSFLRHAVAHLSLFLLAIILPCSIQIRLCLTNKWEKIIAPVLRITNMPPVLAELGLEEIICSAKRFVIVCLATVYYGTFVVTQDHVINDRVNTSLGGQPFGTTGARFLHVRVCSCTSE